MLHDTAAYQPLVFVKIESQPMLAPEAITELVLDLVEIFPGRSTQEDGRGRHRHSAHQHTLFQIKRHITAIAWLFWRRLRCDPAHLIETAVTEDEIIFQRPPAKEHD